MENIQGEPTLEEYGLDTNSYEKSRNETIIISGDIYKILFKRYHDYNSTLGNILVFGGILAGLFLKSWVIFIVSFIVGIVVAETEIANKREEEKRKDEIKKNKLENDLQLIKNKILPFEEASTTYYENYLRNFYEEKLYKKRSGNDEFEKSLSEFSLMIGEVLEISKKLVFKSIDISHYKNYLSDRKINHIQQKNNKQFFNSFENIKINQTESDATNNNVKLLQDNADNDPNKKIKEEFRNKMKQEMSVGNVSHTENESEPQEYNTGNIKQERVTIEDKTSMSDSEDDKNFLVDMFSIFNDEIDSANTSTPENKKIINTVDIISPYKKYNTPRKIDWNDINKNKSITGMKGEEIAFEIEKEYLNSINKEDLAIKVRHVSKDEGDGHGYDILSFFPDGQEKYIEVKSSENTNSTTFKISSNELDFMKRNKDNYQVYRLFNVSNQTNELPTLKIDTANDILNFKKITPSQYIVKME